MHRPERNMVSADQAAPRAGVVASMHVCNRAIDVVQQVLLPTTVNRSTHLKPELA